MGSIFQRSANSEKMKNHINENIRRCFLLFGVMRVMTSHLKPRARAKHALKTDTGSNITVNVSYLLDRGAGKKGGKSLEGTEGESSLRGISERGDEIGGRVHEVNSKTIARGVRV